MTALLEIVYTGSLEATMEEMRRMLILAHSLYISVPVSDQLMKMLGLSLPPLPTLKARPAAPPPVPELAPTFPPSRRTWHLSYPASSPTMFQWLDSAPWARLG